METYAFHILGCYSTYILTYYTTHNANKSAPRVEMKWERRGPFRHHLIQESKQHYKTHFNHPEYQITPGWNPFQYAVLITMRRCPDLWDWNSQKLFLMCNLCQYSVSPYLLIPLLYTHLEHVNGSSLPRGFAFCHFFSGNVIKELGVGCFMHKYSDSLLAINGCRFYYLSGSEFYYLLWIGAGFYKTVFRQPHYSLPHLLLHLRVLLLWLLGNVCH